MATHAYNRRQEKRDSTGRYSKMNECEACSKRIGDNYSSDHRQSGALGVYGLILCAKCCKKMAAMPDDIALDYVMNQRGKPKPSLKDREMNVTGVSAAQWELEAREAARARANRAVASILEDELADVALGALYHAGKLAIGCEPCPPIIYGNSRDHWGERLTPTHTWRESSAYNRGM